MDPQSLAQQELIPGERFVWAGRPDLAALARTRWPVAAGGLFISLFSVFWLTMVLQIPFSSGNGPPPPFLLIFPLVGLVMLGIGLGMLVSPIRQARKSKRMAYAVTDGRVLIIEPGHVQSFDPGDIQHLIRRDKGSGKGDLVFREEQGNLMLAMYTFGAMANRKIGSFGVSDVRSAEDAIRKPKRRAS